MEYQGRKVFVSYKYRDSNVQYIRTKDGIGTNPNAYVKYLKENVFNDYSDNIYKGENPEEDLSNRNDDYIWEHLKDKIYDSTVTIVLISPNLREPNRWESSQWIPWEIAYSLRETTRGDMTSHRNALLCVVLPDKYGSYNYYEYLRLFSILDGNIKNGLAFVVEWDYFLKYPNYCIDKALENLKSTPEAHIVKSV